MGRDEDDLQRSADGAVTLPLGSPGLRAIDRLFATTKRRAGEARSLSLAECRSRFRWRVVYPASGFVLAIPALIAIAGSAGALQRGRFEEEAAELFTVAGLFLLGLGLFVGLFFIGMWRRERAKRVGDWTPEALRAVADQRGLQIERDGATILDGPWSEIALERIEADRYWDRHSTGVWDMRRLALRDGRGRRATLPLYLLDQGHEIACTIFEKLIENDRLRREGDG